MKKMLQKSLLGALLLVGVVSSAQAGLYVGPTLLLRDTIASHSSVRELGLRMSLGYGDFVSPAFYLAGEAFGMPGAAVLRNNTSSGTSVRSTYGYGVSIIPGTPITDSVLGYLRLGVVESRFTSASQTRAGAQAGLGLQTSLTCNWDMRMEYIYTMYGSVSNAGSPKSDWVGLGFMYKFDQI